MFAATARDTPARTCTYEVHIFNAKCGPLKLESSSIGSGSQWVTEPVPYINPGFEATFAAASTSDRMAASASVTYKDLLTNATITFAGKASRVAGASKSQTTGNGVAVASGHQGSFPGVVPDVQVTYTITR